MYCPNCNEPTEESAAYCGNCGRHLKNGAASIGYMGVKSYAQATTLRHAGETQALMSLLCGATGIAGALFIPVTGLTLGVAGLVLGTVSRIYAKKSLHIAGLTLSVIAILAGLATWTYAVRNDPRVNPDVTRAAPASSDAQAASDLSTPCYSLSFVDELNVSLDPNGCNIKAFNGRTLETSTNAYKVFASKADLGSANNFNNLAKSAVEKDIAQSAPDFKINNEKATTFAGSPAFMLTASDPDGEVSIVEAIVRRQVSNGNNLFVIVHANTGATADLQILESQWQWK